MKKSEIKSGLKMGKNRMKEKVGRKCENEREWKKSGNKMGKWKRMKEKVGRKWENEREWKK